jgi:hypothetical protein
MKRSGLLVLSISAVISFAQAEAAEPSMPASPSDSELREWSIVPGEIGGIEPEELKGISICSVNDFYCLSRPGNTKIVAVIQDGFWLNLNRYRFNYGPIPPLKDFTEHTAEVLWGQP